MEKLKYWTLMQFFTLWFSKIYLQLILSKDLVIYCLLFGLCSVRIRECWSELCSWYDDGSEMACCAGGYWLVMFSWSFDVQWRLIVSRSSVLLSCYWLLLILSHVLGGWGLVDGIHSWCTAAACILAGVILTDVPARTLHCRKDWIVRFCSRYFNGRSISVHGGRADWVAANMKKIVQFFFR